MGLRYAVTAQAFERQSGRTAGPSRVEVIDVMSNVLFRGCRTIMDVKAAYESFWNELNTESHEVVFVQQITFKGA